MADRKALTAKDIENSKPKAKAYKLYDTGGLFLLVNPSGGKLWRLKYYFDGKEKLASLGAYPDIPLREARARRDECRKTLSAGADPIEEKKRLKEQGEREAREAALTFEVVAREWYEKKTLNIAEGTRKYKLQRMEKHIFPCIGSIPMSKIDLPDLARALKPLEGKADMGKRIAQILGQVCRYARLMQYARYDVSSGLTETLPDKPPVKHRAAITDQYGIGCLLRAIDDYTGDVSTRYALKIMPYVFVRSKELRLARWEELDLDKALWTLPASHMKMGRAHTVPLAGQVVKLFRELKEWAGGEGLIFKSPLSASKPITDVCLLNALRRMGYGKEEMCVHGFRAMASTLLNEQGYNRDVIETQLAHSEKNTVRAAYNHAQYLPERIRMMQEWADYLDGLKEL